MVSHQIHKFSPVYTRHVHQGAWILEAIFEFSLPHHLWRGALLVPMFASSCASSPQTILSTPSSSCSRTSVSFVSFYHLLPWNPLPSLWISSSWTSDASGVSLPPADQPINFLLQPRAWKSWDEAFPLMCAEGRDYWGACEDKDTVLSCEFLVKGSSHSRKSLIFSGGN